MVRVCPGREAKESYVYYFVVVLNKKRNNGRCCVEIWRIIIKIGSSGVKRDGVASCAAFGDGDEWTDEEIDEKNVLDVDGNARFAKIVLDGTLRVGGIETGERRRVAELEGLACGTLGGGKGESFG
jgi:hypothetical protein